MLPRLGIFALGFFVSFLLVLGLVKSKPVVKIIVAIIGVALGSGPLGFIAGACLLHWIYPLGLVSGLALALSIGPHLNIPDWSPSVPISGRAQMLRVMIGPLIVAALLSVTLVWEHRVVKQEGTLAIEAGVASGRIFFRMPYAQTPSLTFEDVDVRLTELTPDHFVVSGEQDWHGFRSVMWVAEGVGRCE